MDVRQYVDVRESGNVLLVVDILSRAASLELSMFSIPSNFQVVRMFDHSPALCMASTVNISRLYLYLCRLTYVWLYSCVSSLVNVQVRLLIETLAAVRNSALVTFLRVLRTT